MAKTRVILLEMDPHPSGESVNTIDLAKQLEQPDSFVVYVDPEHPRWSVRTLSLPMPRAQFERYLTFLLVALLGAAGLATLCTYAAAQLSRPTDHHFA